MSFQNGKIYKLVCSETGNIYYGSTCDTLKQRLRSHKNPGNICSSKSFINPKIYLIKDFPCNSKKELTDEESKYIKDLDCVNIVIPNRTHKQWKLDNVEKIKKQRKQHRLDIADKIKQYRLDNRERANKKFNCECGGKYIHSSKARHFKTKKHQEYLK